MSEGQAPPRGGRLALFRVRELVTGEGSTFSPVERLVALAIADHMGDGGTAWPSLRRISTWAGLGQTAVRAAIKTLCSGTQAVFHRTPGGARPGARYEATTYRLNERIATREARDVSPSSGDAEGVATRARGYRHATTERLIRTAQGTAHVVDGPLEKETTPPPPTGSGGADAPGTGGGGDPVLSSPPSKRSPKDKKPAADPKAPTFAGRVLVAQRFVGAFNDLFARRVSVKPGLLRDIRDALAAGYSAEDLAVTPFAAAQDEWLRERNRERSLSPEWLLRHKGGLNTTTGQPAKRWLEELLGKVEFVILDPATAKIAEKHGALAALRERGAKFPKCRRTGCNADGIVKVIDGYDSETLCDQHAAEREARP